MRPSGADLAREALERGAFATLTGDHEPRLRQRRRTERTDQRIESFGLRKPADAAHQELLRCRAGERTQRRDAIGRELGLRHERFMDVEHPAAVAGEVALLPLRDDDETVHLQEMRAVDPHVQRGDGGAGRLEPRDEARALA